MHLFDDGVSGSSVRRGPVKIKNCAYYVKMASLDFDPYQVESVETNDQAEDIADRYAPMLQAAYMYEGSGYQDTQNFLNQFYEGVSVDDDLSSRENLVMRNEGTNDAFVAVPGTTGVGDAVSTWPAILSEQQGGLLAALTSPMGLGNQLLARGAVAGAAVMSDRQSFSQRLETTRQTLDAIYGKYGATDTLLLGHSMGGAVSRQVAQEEDVSSIIYNSAVGRSSVSQNNRRRNIEVRISKDVVSASLRAKKREFSIDKGYSVFGSIQAHDLTNFVSDKPRYKQLLTGKADLVRHNPFYEDPKRAGAASKYQVDAVGDFYEDKCVSRGGRRKCRKIRTLI